MNDQTPPADPTSPADPAPPAEQTPPEQTPPAEQTPPEQAPSMTDVQSENEALRAILGGINPDLNVDEELGFVGRGGKYRPPAQAQEAAPEPENRTSRRAPLQNERSEETTEMTNEQIDAEFDSFMMTKYGFKYDDQAQA